MINVGCLAVFALLALLIFNVKAFSLIPAKGGPGKFIHP
jgi:hypothetical protein